MKLQYQIIFLLLFCCSTDYSYSQDSTTWRLQKGLRYNLSADGTSVVNFGIMANIWARYMEMNPGTYNAAGQAVFHDADVLLRRNVFHSLLMYNNWTFFTMFGLSNQNISTAPNPFNSNEADFSMYDLFGSYSFFDEQLILGYGMHIYSGPSRYSNARSSRTIGADVPLLPAPNLLTTKQKARRLGIFAAGSLDALNYRMAFGKPFLVNSENRPPIGQNKAFDVPTTNFCYEGYFYWQFFDRKSNRMPFIDATHLGKAKMLNIGVGFDYQQQATASLTASADSVFHDKLHLAADVFLDWPFSSGGVLTLYGAYFRFDYGPNYYFEAGLADVYKPTSGAGGGIAEPAFGSGRAVAAQAAWLFPYTFGNGQRLQVYYEGEYRFFEALNDAALHHNIGINYYVAGQNLKITLQEEQRPVFENGNFLTRRNLIVLKLQFAI